MCASLREGISEVLQSYAHTVLSTELAGANTLIADMAGRIADFLHTLGSSGPGSASATLTVSANPLFDWHPFVAVLTLKPDARKALEALVARTADASEYFSMNGGWRFTCGLDMSGSGYKSVHDDVSLPVRVALLIPKILLLAANCLHTPAGLMQFVIGASLH